MIRKNIKEIRASCRNATRIETNLQEKLNKTINTFALWSAEYSVDKR